jgi:glycosyltransferase involved in cell wall biosynthesis
MNKKVLFVGSFKEKAKDGSVGGQMFASRSLVDSSIASVITFIKLDTTSISVPSPPAYIRAYFAALRIVKFIYHLILDRPDSVLIFSSTGFSFWEKGYMAIIAKALFKKRVIFSPRSGIIKTDMGKSVKFRKFVKKVFLNSDVVLCQSKEWKDFYLESTKLPHAKFIVQNNWLDVNPYYNLKRIHSESTEDVNLLYIGWLEEYKGIKNLVNVIKILILKYPKIRLTIYGSGSLKDWLIDIIINEHIEGNIIYKGWADFDTKLAAFSIADIFVLPSHTEGMPNVLIEAMASQIACIATDVGGVASLIRDEENGLLIEKNQEKKLLIALETLIKKVELRKKIAIQARTDIYTRHHIDNIKDGLIKILLGNK